MRCENARIDITESVSRPSRHMTSKMTSYQRRCDVILTSCACWGCTYFYIDHTCNGAKVSEILTKYTLQKHAHVIYRKFFGFKNENFQRRKVDIFLIFAQNIDCGYTLEPPWRGGSNEYPQSMFWSKNKKNSYTSAYPSFAI